MENLKPNKDAIASKSTEQLWALFNIIDRMYPTVDMSSTLSYYNVKCANLKIAIWAELKKRVENEFPI